MNMQPQPVGTTQFNISVRPLLESDLSRADRVMRVAFGTFLGLPEPAAFMGDADYVWTRWRSDPSAAFAADIDGDFAGSNFATRWGSVGFVGPLTVRPDLWDRSVGKHLMEPVMDCFDKWRTQHAGLFTFAHSEKHVGLYRKFGFWPRFLTAVMSKPVRAARRELLWNRFSAIPVHERERTLAICREATDLIYDGLDVASEVRAVSEQCLGDTVLLWNDDRLAALAVCHYGPGTEAGSGTCYVKFGAVRPSPTVAQDFDMLLDACEQMALENGLSRLTAGVNTARHEAYRQMLQGGFRTDIQGVAMQWRNDVGYNRPGVYVVDDWR